MNQEMDEALERRLIELETRVAYQDDTLIKLNQTVQVHQRVIYQLETRYETLLERLRMLLDHRENSSEIPNEKPPHY